MKFSSVFALFQLISLGITAPVCTSGEKSAYLLIDGEDKKTVAKVYHEKNPDAKIPDGPLKVTKTSDGDLKINFEETQEKPVKIDCSGAEEQGKDTVSAEGGGGRGDNSGSLFSGLNNWRINWNGPNLNLNLPSSTSMRFPTFNLQSVADEE